MSIQMGDIWDDSCKQNDSLYIIFKQKARMRYKKSNFNDICIKTHH